ncbi:MAG: leucyl/phenylalanyl-tRNA--protein transferase [Deltaproteobacteria bacterium]|nr:MAG: leucyl/phenylalanyl-tRNA--protein transferase [Deltaproteobacteria bacterium]
MPVYRLPEEHLFPPPWEAEPSGLLAVGGDLHPDRLLVAYRMGIFPWYHEGIPICWYAPDPRYVLLPSELHVGRSLKKRMRRGDYEIRLDTAFEQVMRACGEVPRPGQDGTWITEEMVEGYTALHERGFAHSVEAYDAHGQLVGGLYGVAVGGLFAGESMFAKAPDASKVAFATFVPQLEKWGFQLVDCQMETEHLARFGARNIPRVEYLRALQILTQQPERLGPWRFDAE